MKASEMLLGAPQDTPPEYLTRAAQAERQLVDAIKARKNDKKFMAEVAAIVEESRRGKKGPKPTFGQNMQLLTTVDLCLNFYGNCQKKRAYIETGRILEIPWTTVRDRYCKLTKDPDYQECRILS
jgi:hypothetical protein